MVRLRDLFRSQKNNLNPNLFLRTSRRLSVLPEVNEELEVINSSPFHKMVRKLNILNILYWVTGPLINYLYQIQYPRVSLHDIYSQPSEEEDSLSEDIFYRSDSLHNVLEESDPCGDITVLHGDTLRTCQSLDRNKQCDLKQHKQRQFSDSYVVMNNFKSGNLGF